MTDHYDACALMRWRELPTFGIAEPTCTCPKPETAPRIDSFATHILTDWDDAMDNFFASVETKMRARELTPQQVQTVLNDRYGYEVGDAWEDWMEEFDD